jgi:hypothetical protein
MLNGNKVIFYLHTHLCVTQSNLPKGNTMNSKPISTRRHFIKLSGMALSVIPLMLIADNSQATTNVAMRTAMKYQDKPNGDKDCAACIQFVPGKSPTALGGCKLFAGDTEVSPKGYCAGWVAKPK